MSAPVLFSIRFLVFPNGEQFTQSFSCTTTFATVKKILIEKWINLQFPNHEQVKLIYCGKVVEEHQIVQDVLRESQTEIPTVHIVLKKKLPQNCTPTIEVNVEEVAKPIVENSEWHMHGCTFNDDEAQQMKVIFQKKKGTDDKISFDEIVKFLQVYWKWMSRNKYRESAESFPMQNLDAIKIRVLREADRASYDQFLQIFFLFDNCTPEEICPHGKKDRVQKATEALHHALKGTQTSFATELFDQLYKKVDIDNDGILSCKEVELFFYLYSVEVSALA